MTILIKRVGTNYEISNGTVVVSGPNRAQLLALMDTLESTPASAEQIAAKVEQAVAAVAAASAADPKPKKKVKKEKVNMSATVRDFMLKNPGVKHTAQDVADIVGFTREQCAHRLYHWYNQGVLKSDENGIYYAPAVAPAAPAAPAPAAPPA
jgi:hypothetical protein